MILRNAREVGICAMCSKVSAARRFRAFPAIRKLAASRYHVEFRCGMVKMRFAEKTTMARSFFSPMYFQIRKTNVFDASNVSGGSQWLDTFLFRELLDVSRIRVLRRHRRLWNLQRGIYFRCANNRTITRRKICDICKRYILFHYLTAE